ncbi:MAG: hypothetical protein EB060_08695 [Proteobacteria bacterium]|nr:hypothetical protein [Pseudomonadota bacterium]
MKANLFIQTLAALLFSSFGEVEGCLCHHAEGGQRLGRQFNQKVAKANLEVIVMNHPRYLRKVSNQADSSHCFIIVFAAKWIKISSHQFVVTPLHYKISSIVPNRSGQSGLQLASRSIPSPLVLVDGDAEVAVTSRLSIQVSNRNKTLPGIRGPSQGIQFIAKPTLGILNIVELDTHVLGVVVVCGRVQLRLFVDRLVFAGGRGLRLWLPMMPQNRDRIACQEPNNNHRREHNHSSQRHCLLLILVKHSFCCQGKSDV